EAWKFARRNKGGYVIENDILYHEELLGGNRIKQLVIPEMRKRKTLEIAHESHLGAHKTIQRIKFSFYWPGCRTGIPKVINDNATNFTASLTQEFLKILGACPRFSTPYHPEGNGLIERWNQTLKNMLHDIIREEGRSWQRHIPFLLWLIEVPNATTGTPPFLLMYGRDPKGPFSILKSISTENTLLPLEYEGSVESYLKKLKEKLGSSNPQSKVNK
ncbi:retrovirus-related Pol polyprotein from transposon 17.6, partial [Trichonephila clavipes]